MVEVHRQRIDKVADAIRWIDELMTLVERLTLENTTFTMLDDLHATAEHALEVEHDEAVDFQALTTQLRDGLEAVISAHIDPDDGIAFEHTLTNMLLRMKVLRAWINDAQLDYDIRMLDV